MIFVDTSYWVALQMARDSRHADAVALMRDHGDEPLITSNHVRGETWTLLRRRAGHRAAVEFVGAVERSPRVELAHLDEELERGAYAWLRDREERASSFVDATSFALMRRRRITRALAFDGDFTAAGFVELRSARPRG